MSTQDIADLNKSMIEACAADPQGALCATLQQQYMSMTGLYNQQNPLPRASGLVPQTDPVKLTEQYLDYGACGVGVATAETGYGAALAFYGCARSLGF